MNLQGGILHGKATLGGFSRTIQNFSYFLFADSIFLLEMDGVYIMNFAYCLHILFVIWKKIENLRYRGDFLQGEFSMNREVSRGNLTRENFPELLYLPYFLFADSILYIEMILWKLSRENFPKS